MLSQIFLDGETHLAMHRSLWLGITLGNAGGSYAVLGSNNSKRQGPLVKDLEWRKQGEQDWFSFTSLLPKALPMVQEVVPLISSRQNAQCRAWIFSIHECCKIAAPLPDICSLPGKPQGWSTGQGFLYLTLHSYPPILSECSDLCCGEHLLTYGRVKTASNHWAKTSWEIFFLEERAKNDIIGRFQPMRSHLPERSVNF